MQAQPIAIGELAQAMHIEVFEQRRGLGVDGVTVDADFAGHRGLVVADAGDEVQQPQRAFGRGGTRGIQVAIPIKEWRARHDHGFDQFGAVVVGVDELRDAGPRIEIAAHEAEHADRVAVENPIVHSVRLHSRMSSAGNARRLYSLAMLEP